MHSSTLQYRDNTSSATPKRLHNLKSCGNAHMKTILNAIHRHKFSWKTIFKRLVNYINSKEPGIERIGKSFYGQPAWYASDNLIILQKLARNYLYEDNNLYFITPKTIFSQPTYPIVIPSLDGHGIDRIYKEFEEGDVIRIWGTKSKKQNLPSISSIFNNLRSSVLQTVGSINQTLQGRYDHVVCEIQSAKTGQSFTFGFGYGIGEQASAGVKHMYETLKGGIKTPDYLFDKDVLREYAYGNIGDYIELFAFGRITADHLHKMDAYFDMIQPKDINWRVNEIFATKKNPDDMDKNIEQQRATQLKYAKSISIPNPRYKEYDAALVKKIADWQRTGSDYFYGTMVEPTETTIRTYDKSNRHYDQDEDPMKPWTRHSIGLGCIINVETEYCMASLGNKSTVSKGKTFNCASWATALFSDLISCGTSWTVAHPSYCYSMGDVDCTKTGNPIPPHNV